MHISTKVYTIQGQHKLIKYQPLIYIQHPICFVKDNEYVFKAKKWCGIVRIFSLQIRIYYLF